MLAGCHKLIWYNEENGPKVTIVACLDGNIEGNTSLYAGTPLKPYLREFFQTP